MVVLSSSRIFLSTASFCTALSLPSSASHSIRADSLGKEIRGEPTANVFVAALLEERLDDVEHGSELWNSAVQFRFSHLSRLKTHLGENDSLSSLALLPDLLQNAQHPPDFCAHQEIAITAELLVALSAVRLLWSS